MHLAELRIFKIRDVVHLFFGKTFYSVVFDSNNFTCGQLRARLDLSLQSGQVLQLEEYFFEPFSLKKRNEETPSIKTYSDLF